MASTYSLLKFELPGTGEQSGTWGTTTNTNVGTAIEQAIVGMATLEAADFTANVATLTLANTNAAQDARALCLNIDAGAVSAAGTVNVPAIEKPYIIINGSSFTVTVKVSGQTGVAVPAGKRTVVYNNGTDVGSQINWLAALEVAGNVTLSGGTANGVAFLNASNVLTTGSALTFDGTNLGVGTSSPGFRLDSQVSSVANNDQQIALRLKSTTTADMVDGFGVTMLYSIQDNAGANRNIAQLRAVRDGADDSGAFVFAPYLTGAANERMRITSDGNVGIGTSSPDEKLEVAGDIKIATGANAGVLHFGETSDAVKIVSLGSLPSNQTLEFHTNTAERMRITSAGNVGIGTTGPNRTLSVHGNAEVFGASRTVLQVADSAAQAAGRGGGIAFTGNITDGTLNGNSWFATIQGFKENSTSGDVAAAMAFCTRPSGGNPTERMRIDSAGNVGIGTSSPGSLLTVNGNILAPWTNTGTYEIGINQRPANAFSTNSSVFVVRGADSIAGAQAMGGGSVLIRGGSAYGTAAGGAGNVTIQGGASQDGSSVTPGVVIFRTGSTTTERARIDSSGNLLVGTTSAIEGSTGTADGVSLYGGALGRIVISANDDRALELRRRLVNGQVVQFFRDTTQVGNISVTTTATAYNTTSDYRLKTVIGPVADAGQRIDALQPVEYTWNSDGSRTRGFLAHQFQEVYAGSVTGDKDAVDAQGKPVYQAMQAGSSEVIADLVAELQSLRARVAALESN